MFGHQSFSELPLSTVLFRIFVTPTGVSITATVDSSFVGVSGSAGIVVEKDFVETGTSTFRNASGSSVTEQDIRDLAAAQVVESTRIDILEKLGQQVRAGEQIFISSLAKEFFDTINSVSADFFDESTAQAASGASAARAQFGISVELGNMVSILNGGGILTNMQGVSGITEIGQVLVWGNIEISQDPSYTKITPNQTASYSQVQPSQTPSFSKVTPSQTPSYSLVTPNQSPSWDQQQA